MVEVLADIANHDRADRHQDQRHRQGVDEQQVIGDLPAPQAHRHEQKTEPAANQKREGPLDIDLGQGNQRSHQGRGATDSHEHGLHQGAKGDQRLQPQQHPGAAGHHHRIAQHRGGQGAFHCFIQPEMQGDLGALAHRTGNQGQQYQAGAQRQAGALAGLVGSPGLQAMEIPGTRHRQQGHQARQQHQVADPFGQKGIPRTFDNQGLVVPGADDQIGAQGEQFENRVTEEQGVG